MNDDFKVNAKATKVSNDKTKQQEAELAAAKKHKAEVEATTTKKAETKATTTTKSETNNSSLSSEDLIKASTSIVNSIGKKKSKGFLSGLIIGLVVGALLMGILGFSFKDQIFGKVASTKEGADALLDEGLLGYTAADFQDAILGAATQHQELVVMEQPLQISTTITKAGLGNLSIFSKVKTVTYYGTGVYTVDLKNIDKDHIKVDAENKTVTVIIPHAVLQYVNPDLSKTEFEDTEKGLLAFGDLSLTTEQQNQLSQSVTEAMKERLEEDDMFTQADEYATMKTWEIFQPLISAVSSEYKVVMQFED